MAEMDGGDDLERILAAELAAFDLDAFLAELAESEIALAAWLAELPSADAFVAELEVEQEIALAELMAADSLGRLAAVLAAES
jgi:hypothetical protein